MAQDPWAEAAKQFQSPDVRTGATASGKSPAPYAEGVSNPPNDGQVLSTAVAEPNDDTDWKLFQQGTAPPATSHEFSSELLKETPWALKEAGIGGLKSLGNTLYGLSTLVVPDKDEAANRHVFDPSNPVQEIGRRAEQVGEFLVPGLGEEAATERAGKLAPLARIGYNSLSSGLLNKAQGGDFTTGAVAGGAGSAIAEGGKAIAPSLAEGAMGIKKLDRAYGRTPGQAILDETKGFAPSNVAESAQSRLSELNPRLENLVDAASSRPAPRIAGLLPAPENEIPLSAERVPSGTRGGLFPANESLETGSPWSEAHANDSQWGRNLRAPGSFLDSLLPEDAATVPNPIYESGSAHPELSGRYTPPKGTLLSRNATGGRMPIDEFGRVAYPEALPSMSAPTEVPNTITSLRAPRNIVSDAMRKATKQNAAGTFGQLTPLRDFLATRFDSGEEIPEQVTPRQLLDLRRGFGDEFVHSWNPETQPGVTGTARKTYHAMTDELHNAVPDTVPIDRRISSLIPVAKRAASTDLNASVAQRVANRIGRPTGGLLPAIFGGHVAGVPGAVAGMIAPDALSMPTVQMGLARALHSPATGWLGRLLLGGGLQSQHDQQ